MFKTYPDPQELIHDAQRRVVLHVQRSLLSIMSYIFAFAFSAIIVVLIIMFLGDMRLPTDLPVLRSLSPRWLAVVPAYFLIEMLRRYHDDLYIFGKHRVTHLNGRLSLSYSIPVVKYSDIRGISVKQDLMGRAFNYGNVELGTAAKEGPELIIEGVRSPKELAFIVEELRKYSRELSLKKQAAADCGVNLGADEEEQEAIEMQEAIQAVVNRDS